MHTALILAQAQPPAGGGNASGTASWLTFVLLLAAVGVMSKFGNTVIKILSIAMSMGAVGIFLTLVHVPFIDQVNTAVSGWLSVGNTSFTPILMIAISIGIRAAQVFQQANETV